ncbi:hypothetical protein CMV_022745 [Castanea mollissima]|uniref:Uncharacterized protein n=1 Tax=Castanea mollissima TaxID=60419 RepID=A0A8J4VJZ6_9ROSI|nr:hypothetical protein CMV_022745 [Castanea mollissima]
MMKGVPYVVTVAILALAFSLASAYDPSPLQDFCVAINNTDSAVFVNGKFCKDPATVTANDFFFSGLNIPGNTAARYTEIHNPKFLQSHNLLRSCNHLARNLQHYL